MVVAVVAVVYIYLWEKLSVEYGRGYAQIYFDIRGEDEDECK